MSAIGLPGPHVDPHLPGGLCVCPCDECTTRLTKLCVCLECRCESAGDHSEAAHSAVLGARPGDKVYVVYDEPDLGYYGGGEVYGVFVDRATAEERAAQDGGEIAEMEIEG